MRITKVYTRGGDKGETSLVGGKRASKNHPRIEAYGTVDELNAIVGLCRVFLTRSGAKPEVVDTLDKQLYVIQNDLFNVGADLATPSDQRWKDMIRVGASATVELEGWIDVFNEELPPLKEFILPGGGPVGAFFHQARTVCRRAERDVVSLMEDHPDVDVPVLVYLNRLSDYLFVAGRWAAKACGANEVFWTRNPSQRDDG